MKKIRKIYILAAAVLVFLVSAGGASLYLDKSSSELKVRGTYTHLKNLEPGSEISYRMTFAQQYGDMVLGDGSKESYEGAAKVDANGEAYLPDFRPYIKSYEIVFAQDGKKASLLITQNPLTQRLEINGRGFEKFTDVFIGKNDKIETVKTDWVGLFSESLSYADNETEDMIRLAFNGMHMNDAGNPALVEVVIGQGGGPTNAQVNIYNPRIHEYNCGRPVDSTNGVEIFYVSTCDQARMATHIEGVGPNTMTNLIVAPMMLMAEELSAVMMQQMQIIGSFFDAKIQMETQRDLRELVAKATKDYHPSEQMCHFGSSVLSLSHSEEWSEMNKQSLNVVLSNYYRDMEHMSSSEGPGTDIRARIDKFIETYCDPNDNAGGLWEMCKDRTNEPGTNPTPSDAAPDRNRYNKDIDYFGTLSKPLTLEVNFTDNVSTNDEEDVIALAKNLYWPQAQDMPNKEKLQEGFDEDYRLYLATRSIDSMYNVAHNSFINIVGMKSSTEPLGPTSGPSYMKALMRNFRYSGGSPNTAPPPPPTDADIDAVMGVNPSYYAQMEYLSKKMYQDPNFYTALYDKPVNVDRMNVTLEAIQLMHYRDRYESQLRQEMLTSMLVEAALMKNVRDVNARISSLSRLTKPITSDGQ